MRDIPMDTNRALRILGYSTFNSYATDSGLRWDIRDQSWVDADTGALRTLDDICAQIQSEATALIGHGGDH